MEKRYLFSSELTPSQGIGPFRIGSYLNGLHFGRNRINEIGLFYRAYSSPMKIYEIRSRNIFWANGRFRTKLTKAFSL